ncbi:hypothetical protein BH09SUM1_BH09SUM1_21090 [soil metagenome]
MPTNNPHNPVPAPPRPPIIHHQKLPVKTAKATKKPPRYTTHT